MALLADWPPPDTHFRRSLAKPLARGAALAVLIVASLAVPAAADVTGVPCDDVPKYWCFQVDYTPNGSGATVNVRNAKGGRDGGAREWQRYQTTDLHQDSGTGVWTTISDFGPGAMHTNIPLDTIDACSNCSIAQVASVSVVRLYIRYYEYTDHWYYWCSQGVDFHVSDTPYQASYYLLWIVSCPQ